MSIYELTKEELKERLSVLKSIKNFDKKNKKTRVVGEIKYIEELLQASEFSTNNEFSIL